MGRFQTMWESFFLETQNPGNVSYCLVWHDNLSQFSAHLQSHVTPIPTFSFVCFSSHDPQHGLNLTKIIERLNMMIIIIDLLNNHSFFTKHSSSHSFDKFKNVALEIFNLELFKLFSKFFNLIQSQCNRLGVDAPCAIIGKPIFDIFQRIVT